jgi:flagellar basal-body rod protein FlgB
MTRPIAGSDPLVADLRRVLDRVARRAAATAANVANVDTPGYRAVDVVFPELDEAETPIETSRTSSRHLAVSPRLPGGGVVTEIPFDRMRNDGNTVDIDQEMTRMAQLQGRYSQATELARARLALLAYAATDGRAG